MIEKNIKEDFLELFYHDISSEKLANDNTLDLFILKIRNNSFTYDELIQELGNKLYYFSLSRQQIKKLKDEDKLNDLIRRSKEKLRKYSVNDGELGEILLYCLIECHLNAPKILTKLELKTAANDYVKGADGVHLLKLSEKEYQLVLGEAKLNSELAKGIYEAFSSIKKLLTENGKLQFEIDLVNSELVKESFDESQYQILKKIIIPSAKDDETYMDYSFGIFLGYDVKISEEDKRLTNSEFRIAIRERIKSEIISNINTINFQINKEHFTGYKFYVYIVPFTDLEDKRKEIIKIITE